jgi:hypothetical protein
MWHSVRLYESGGQLVFEPTIELERPSFVDVVTGRAPRLRVHGSMEKHAEGRDPGFVENEPSAPPD